MSTFENVRNTYVAACNELNGLFVEEKEKNDKLEKKINDDNNKIRDIKEKIEDVKEKNKELKSKNETIEKELNIDPKSLQMTLADLEFQLKFKEKDLKSYNDEHDKMMSKKETLVKNPKILRNIYELIGKLQRKKASHPSEGGTDSQTASEENAGSSVGQPGPNLENSQAENSDASEVTDAGVLQDLNAEAPQQPDPYVPQPANPEDLQGSPAYVPQGLNIDEPKGKKKHDGTQELDADDPQKADDLQGETPAKGSDKAN